MQAHEVMDHSRSLGHWVDWTNTTDQFLHGDPQAEVAGIAVTWIPTNEVIREAAGRGLNLIVSHEGAFLNDYYAGHESSRAVIQEKRDLLDSLGMVVMRCHDVWDRMPQVGIPDAWADWLGYETEERATESYYKICLTRDATVEDVARHVGERVRDLGQDTVLIHGDRSKRVSRMAVGTGAITHLPLMYELGADVMLVTDDGIQTTSAVLYALELGVPLIVVAHATAEKPGMMAMAQHLRSTFAAVPVEYLAVDMCYRRL